LGELLDSLAELLVRFDEILDSSAQLTMLILFAGHVRSRANTQRDNRSRLNQLAGTSGWILAQHLILLSLAAAVEGYGWDQAVTGQGLSSLIYRSTDDIRHIGEFGTNWPASRRAGWRPPGAFHGNKRRSERQRPVQHERGPGQGEPLLRL
jgi:hypothetical protein